MEYKAGAIKDTRSDFLNLSGKKKRDRQEDT